MASRVLNDFKWALSRVVPCLHVVHLKSVNTWLAVDYPLLLGSKVSSSFRLCLLYFEKPLEIFNNITQIIRDTFYELGFFFATNLLLDNCVVD